MVSLQPGPNAYPMNPMASSVHSAPMPDASTALQQAQTLAAQNELMLQQAINQRLQGMVGSPVMTAGPREFVDIQQAIRFRPDAMARGLDRQG